MLWSVEGAVRKLSTFLCPCYEHVCGYIYNFTTVRQPIERIFIPIHFLDAGARTIVGRPYWFGDWSPLYAVVAV